jgi:hypothetical protein
MARGGNGLPKVSLEAAIRRLMAVSGVARPPVAVFYPFGHPTPYVYVHSSLVLTLKCMSLQMKKLSEIETEITAISITCTRREGDGGILLNIR